MNFVSKAALAAAVSFGLSVSPALAQKKNKKEEAAAAANGQPALKLSDPFRKQAQALQTSSSSSSRAVLAAVAAGAWVALGPRPSCTTSGTRACGPSCGQG